MNTRTILHRAASFSFAAIATVMMLAAMDALAKQEPSAALMARAAAAEPA